MIHGRNGSQQIFLNTRRSESMRSDTRVAITIITITIINSEKDNKLSN